MALLVTTKTSTLGDWYDLPPVLSPPGTLPSTLRHRLLVLISNPAMWLNRFWKRLPLYQIHTQRRFRVTLHWRLQPPFGSLSTKPVPPFREYTYGTTIGTLLLTEERDGQVNSRPTNFLTPRRGETENEDEIGTYNDEDELKHGTHFCWTPEWSSVLLRSRY